MTNHHDCREVAALDSDHLRAIADCVAALRTLNYWLHIVGTSVNSRVFLGAIFIDIRAQIASAATSFDTLSPYGMGETMGTPYVGEIRLMANAYAPYGWAVCNGQIISIAENPALFNLIGTIYGGDGVNTFGLPDLRGRVPVHIGTLAGTTYMLGERAGVEQVTLIGQQTAAHNHLVNVTATGQQSAPSAQTFPAAAATAQSYIYGPTGSNPVQMNGGIIVSGGGGNQPHENRQPYLAINFYIALYGAYPSSN